VAFVDWFLSFLPILAILILMLGLRWRGMQAGAVGWLIALLVAVLRFGAGWELLANAQFKGLIMTLSVTYILWGALLFFRVTDEAGAVTAVGAGLPRLTPDRGMQALLLGWVFSTFLQGVGGFGVPVAVVAPLLVGLGFPPLAAIVIPSVGHPWAVTFGSQGSSFFTLMQVTGRSAEELAPWSAAFLGLACLACGAGTLWAAGGWHALRTNLATVLVVGSTMAGVQYLVATRGLWSLGATLAGLRKRPPSGRPPGCRLAARSCLTPSWSSSCWWHRYRPSTIFWAGSPWGGSSPNSSRPWGTSCRRKNSP
jgi:lactate permease